MFGVTGRCVASILSSGRCRLPGRGSILPKSPRQPETLFRVWRFVGLSRMVGSGQLRLFFLQSCGVGVDGFCLRQFQGLGFLSSGY